MLLATLFIYFSRAMSSGYLVEEKEFDFLRRLGIEKTNYGVFADKWTGNGEVSAFRNKHMYNVPRITIFLHSQTIKSVNPADGRVIAEVVTGNLNDFHQAVSQTNKAWQVWTDLPAPQRGEIVRQIGNALREKKDDLGKLISLEMGKILSEGLGEVQEYIDICDYAVGLSRMLQGQVLPSERPNHVLLENWNPLGAIGVISAFNFPGKTALYCVYCH